MAARHGNITPAEIRTAMQTTAQDLGTAGRDDYYGYGLINLNAALGSIVPIVSSISEITSAAGENGIRDGYGRA